MLISTMQRGRGQRRRKHGAARMRRRGASSTVMKVVGPTGTGDGQMRKRAGVA